jgi:hypothetical protein
VTIELVFFLFAACVLLAAAFVGFAFWNARMPRKSVGDFPDLVRSLLVGSSNGGIIKFTHSGSSFWFSIERLDGDDESATLAIRIPRTTISELRGQLEEIFGVHDFEIAYEPEDNPSLAARVLVPVRDIWDESSGARGAHAMRLLIQGASLSLSDKFNCEKLAYPSDRVYRLLETDR